MTRHLQCRLERIRAVQAKRQAAYAERGRRVSEGHRAAAPPLSQREALLLAQLRRGVA